MATTSNNRVRQAVVRLAALGVCGLFAGGLLEIGGSPAAADTRVERQSVPLNSTSSTQPVTLAQFDPALGTLEQVTVTVSVQANLEVEVTNLTPAAKDTTVVLDATAAAAGPGVTGLTAVVDESVSEALGPDEAFTFNLDGSGSEPQTVTAPPVLARFTGTGSVTFDVTGAFGVDVHGPATWRARGTADATATVTVEYEFTPSTPPTTSTSSTTTTTTPSIPPVAADDDATVVEDDPATPVDVLGNDTDPDGGPMTVESVTQPADGTVVITNGGADLTYQPDPNYCNDPPGTTPDTFTYTLNGGSTATVSATVTCVDDPPTAAADTATVAEDDPATTVDVLDNDVDVEGDPISITAVTQPANGTVVVTNGGAGLTYQPDPNYCNNPPAVPADTFTYTLNGGSTATVSVTVTCVDDPPTAVADSATVAEDSGATTIDVLANDTDPDGDASIDAVTQPADGTVVVTNGGAGLTYEPDPDYCNDPDPPAVPADTFDYTLNGGSTATVSVTVTCVDDPPVAADDDATVVEDDPATPVDVLGNDTDPDGGPMTVESVTQPADGTVVITNGGADLTYQPDPNYCNDPPGTTPDTFTYTLNGGSTATVSATVTCVDDPPTAAADTATVAEDDPATTVDVLDNDVDVEGDPISITAVTQPANGTVVVTNGGAGLTYQPDPNYCNNPPAVPADTFTYTLNGGSTATVSVTVTCVDDPPTAVADSATVAEDSGATTIDVLANDTDPDGDASIDAVTQPADGTVVVTNGGAGLTYEPDPDYCNDPDPPAVPADTFDYTLNGGSTATVSVTVTCVDDPPVAADDDATVVEDDPATPVDVLGNDTDPDGGPMTVESVTQPADGTVVITNGGADLTYQPDPNYCNDPPGTTPDTFTYTLNGGSTATVSVTVTCVAEDPVAVDDTATVAEDSGATTVDVLDNDVDPDSVGMSINTVTPPANGTVVITNDGDDLTYQPDPDYCNDPDPPPVPADMFTYSLTPGDDTATVSVTVTCVDDPPTAVNDSATLLEDAAATAVAVLANDIDVDAGPIAIDTVTQPTNGTVAITGGGTGLTYQPAANYCNSQAGGTPDTFTYTLTPGTSTATVSMTVTCVNDAPVAVNDAATVLEDAAATAVNVLANDTDVEGDPITIGSVTQPTNGTVAITGGGTGLTYQPNLNYCNNPPGTTLDTFTYTLTPGGSTATVSLTVTCVDDPPVAVNDAATVLEDAAATAIPVLTNDTDVDGGPRSISGASDPANGTVVVTGGGTGLTYQPDPNYCNNPPGTTLDTFTYTLTPGSSTATVTVSVTCVDDPPVAVNDAATVLEDAAGTAIPVLANDTDVDGGPRSISGASDPANGTVVVTGGGTGLTYQPDPNYCNNPPGTTLDTFTYTLNGGSTATVAMTVTCVNDPPVADNETFNGADSAVGNTTFIVNDPTDGAPTVSGPNKTITGDLLDGDSDVDGPGPLVIVAGTTATADGGSVTIQADGDFTYTPVAGTSCTDTTDSFTYTVSDQNPGTPGTAPGTVTINLAGCVWYVSNNAAGNLGTSSAPFDTLAQADTATPAGDVIFVFDGDNTTTGYIAGVSLAANQQLIGEAANLVVGGATLHTGIPANRPTITDNNADVVDLAAGNTVTGLDIDPQGTGGGIAGGTGDAGGTITGVNIVDTATAGTQPGLELDATSGTFNISTLSVSTNGATGVRLNNAGTVNFVPAGTITIAGAGAKGLDVTGTNLGISTFDAITVTGSGTGGVSLTTTTGTTTFADLSLTTTSGAAAVFALSNAGTVTVPAAGTANVNATGGPAVDVTGTAGATLAFDAVSSTNSANDGINLAGLGTGTFSAASGTITGAAGIAFDLDGGNGTITYPGALNNGAGQTAEITGRTGGTVTLSGPIADTNDAGGGISLSGNTGGSTELTNASKVLNTTTANAVSFTGSNGHTLTLSGGGLDIDTTSGRGINADDSGTISVTGTGNTIDSTTGIALNVVATDIAAADMTFQRISANGGASGIVLNATGSSGGLTVTGGGSTDGSGGTIQNTTTRGVNVVSSAQLNLSNMTVTNGATADFPPSPTGLSLGNNTADNAAIHIQGTNAAALTNVDISGSAEQGINLHEVTSFSLVNSSMVNAGNGPDEDGIHAYNLRGTNVITNTTITSSGDDNVNVQWNDVLGGTDPVGSITVTGGSFNTGVLGSGLLFGIRAQSDIDVLVTGPTINNNFSGGVVADTFDTATSDIEVTGATITNNNDAVAVSGDDGNTTFDVHDNAMSAQDFVNVSVLLAADPVLPRLGGSLQGFIRNNTITTANGRPADGILVFAAGQGTLTAGITGNTFNYAGTQRAIAAQGGQDGAGALNLTVTGNTIDIQLDGTGNAVTGVFAQASVTSPEGDGSSLCADIGGAGALSNTFTHSLGGTLAAGDIRIRQRFNATARLPGYAGGATDSAAVSAYLNGRNAEVSPSTATADSTGFAGGGACTQPVVP